MDKDQYLDKNVQTPRVFSAKSDTNAVNMPSTFIQKIKSKTFLVILLTTIFTLVIFILSAPFIPFVVGGILGIFIGREEVQSIELGGLIFVILGFAIAGVIFALFNGIVIYFFLKKLKFLFIGIFTFYLLFAIVSAIYASYEQYQTARVTTKIEKAIGKDPLILTYVSSTSSYDSDNFLNKLDVVFNITAPETGKYKLDGYLTTPYDKYGSIDQDIPETDSFTNVQVELIKGMPTQVTLPFDMNTITSVDYTGNLKLSFRVWRIDLNIKTAGSYKYHKATIEDYPIQVKDSGKSTNFIVTKDYGVEEPVYTIGPFATINPAITIKPSETISNFTPPANWKKFEAQELTFYYPDEWKPESLTPTKEIPLSVQFYAPNAQIPRGEQVLVFTKSTYPAIGHIKSFKETHGFTVKPVSMNGKNVTKIGEPGKTEFIIYPTKEGYIEFFSNASHDVFYQILGTIKFTPLYPIDELINWKMYTDEQISFKYPSNLYATTGAEYGNKNIITLVKGSTDRYTNAEFIIDTSLSGSLADYNKAVENIKNYNLSNKLIENITNGISITGMLSNNQANNIPVNYTLLKYKNGAILIRNEKFTGYVSDEIFNQILSTFKLIN